MNTEERIALVEASQRVYQENIETAILCERERCANIAEEYWYGEGFDRQGLIDAIRKGE